MREPSPYFIRRPTRIEPEPVHDPLRYMYESEHEGIDLTFYLRVLRKHLRLIVALFAGALLLGLIRVISATPIYTAEATILITAPEPNVIDAKGGEPRPGDGLAAPDYYKTQCDILRSRSLAGRVIALEGLDRDAPRQAARQTPSLTSVIISSLRGWLRDLRGLRTPARPVKTGAPDPDEVERHLIDGYLGALSIKPLNDTSLVGIEFSSTDPQLAARIANAHARAYITQGIELHRHAKEQAADFLQQKLVELKEKLQDSEIALNNYRRAHGIIPGLTSLNGKDAIVLDRLSQLSHDLTAAQVARISLEAQVQLIKKGDYKSLPTVVSNTSIAGLQAQLDDLYAEDASLSSRFKADYPKLATLHAKMRGIQDRINAEISREIKSIESGYQEASAKEAKLEDEMNQQRTLTMNLNDAGVQYAFLQREVDANRELYDSVLKAMKDVRVAAEAETSNVSIIDRAVPPDSPSSPRVTRTIALSGAMGLLGGIALAFLLDYLDNTLKEPEDVGRYLRLPTLTMVPKFPRRHLVSEISNPLIAYGAGSGDGGAGGGALVKAPGYYGSVGESYRTLRASMLLAQGGETNQITLITSALASEGKTITAVNSAVVLALSGRRVLLLDADLRKPRCHRYLAAENRQGLAQILGADVTVESAVQPTLVNNLFFIGSGLVPRNPSELLGSMAMRRTLEQLKGSYDSIVIDSPPVMFVSDALLLSKLVDGVALVVDSSATPRQKVRAACARLNYAKARLLGIVLNKAYTDYDYYRYESDEIDENQRFDGVGGHPLDS
jgi:polysaccharide biosynthesis transport protein